MAYGPNLAIFLNAHINHELVIVDIVMGCHEVRTGVIVNVYSSDEVATETLSADMASV